ncbi:probable inactive receptor kinase At5g67200 [Trifolium pratense]|uniref:Uncharacterized protein n=1 Tax=Trifolium pratense TaxID=57577 RepID=A0ACB0JAI9_TRIPR|nr:probable inactive receptor kinase At5g67200 [Trifolium pratense]CAJ2640948.1 unnamed protein product [Trifolium pratense]
MVLNKNHSNIFISLSLLLLLLSTTTTSSKLKLKNITLSDPTSLLSFKSKADINNHLNFTTKTSFCNWQGVQCNNQHKIIRLVLRNLDLAGVFSPHTLSNLDQLRVLSLQNNSLTGTIPNLSGLFNLKTLFLDNNHFTGSIPLSIFSLHRLKTLDFSHNNLSGTIPIDFINLDRLYYLRLSFNAFNGSVPSFNQSSLRIFDVSSNNLSGAVPLTTTLSRFQPSSFALNPNLCGEIIRRECRPSVPFFAPTTPPTVGLNQSAKVHGLIQQPYQKKHDRRAVIIGFSTGIFVLLVSLACFAIVVKKQIRNKKKGKGSSGSSVMASDAAAATAEAAVVMQMEQERELEEKVKRAQVAKSGSLIFCAGESQVYTLDQLMKGSAELLGRGCLGTTYKAVLDNRLIVTVKRLDCGKMGVHVNKDVFERHMESVGGLRHPNLVPLRAYFQANQERLIIYDYQPNGSLYSLIHGSKSSRARPLHWTSCLKIAEDVAQGLSYIHQAWRLVHGNLKSTNVLLGPDFEACITDYCLSVLTNPSTFDEVGDSAPYRAPETRNPNHQPTTKSDVYAYGILLLELLTGKYASELPFMVPGDMSRWVRSIRDDNGSEDNRMDMLLQVATTCSLISPEQRPTMWQVLKMLQEIKEIVLLEDSELDLSSNNVIAMS